MLLDTDQLHNLYDKLWVYFVDHHIMGIPALGILVLAVLMIGEVIFRDWDKTATYRVFVRRSMTAKIDVVFSLLQYLGLSFFLEIVFTLGVALVAVRLADIWANHLSWRITLPSDGPVQIAFSFLVFWLAQSFVSYWVHRVYHWPSFWNLHRFHHSAPELNFVTMWRVHPAEPFVRILFFLMPMFVLKISDSVLLVSILVNHIINYCQHSDLDWDWGWIGRWLFGSPYVHQLHHSIDEEHRDKNFCSCPLWDHVFGTWYDGEKKPSGYGVTANGSPDYGYDTQPVRQFMQDTMAFYRDLAAGAFKPFRTAISWMRAPSGSDAALASSVATLASSEERMGV